MAKKKKRETKKAAAAEPAAAGPLMGVERDRLVRRVSRQFQAAIPSASASRGVHTFPEGGEEFAIADGTYRVDGAAWAFVFKAGRLLEAQLVSSLDSHSIAVSAND